MIISMKEEGKKSYVWLAVSVFIFVAGLLFVLKPAMASVACHKYHEYKDKFHNEEDKEDYFKIKWMEKHDNKLYMYYKYLCESHKFDAKTEFSKLNEMTQRTCREYYHHEGYENYLYYKEKCHRDHDNDEPVPQPEPEPN
jgi:hypothetical protein